VKTQIVRIYLWLCAIFFAIFLIARARMIWPEHPTLLTAILFLFAISSIVMLVDTIRRGRPLRRPRRSSPLRIVLIIIAVITTFLALVGLLYIISPWLFINVMRLLPTSIQEWMLMDFVLRGTGFWIFAIVSGILWYIISRKR
jgi:hypothetical protein